MELYCEAAAQARPGSGASAQSVFKAMRERQGGETFLHPRA